MGSCRKIEVVLDDKTPHKWIIPMTEEGFQGFISKGTQVVRKVFGEGSIFSPLLFGKFFDPSDAFPLWDFEADVLLSNLRSNGHNEVDWFHTDKEFVLKAELPGVGEENIQISIEKGKIIEISGQWKHQLESKPNDWRSTHWWEHGFVRRLEFPDKAAWKKTTATVKNDMYLEIIIPMKPSASHRQGSSDSEKD